VKTEKAWTTWVKKNFPRDHGTPKRRAETMVNTKKKGAFCEIPFPPGGKGKKDKTTEGVAG